MKYLGIDLGGTNVAAAVVDEEGAILGKVSLPTPRGVEAVADQMAAASRAAAEAAELSMDEIASVGIGSPGAIDPETGVVKYWSNLDFRDVPLAEMMTKRLGKEIYLENDANAAALGEYAAGAGKGSQSLVLVTLGTGVGSGAVLGGKLSGKLKPEYILPFKLDKKAAITQLTRYYKGKAFLPKAFKSQNHIAEIQGVYVPFWLYDAKADARGRYEGQNSESHREGDYMVTTTQHYDVRREGSAAFAKVPVDGSSKMPNTHMDAIEPFDYGDLKPFSTAYLPGYLADRYDEDADACAERAYRRMYNSTADALHATTGGYSEIHPISENINVDLTHAHYALLPVWMLHTRWKDKDFLFAMNGQTGRLIGDLPVDKSRVAAWFAGISLPLMAVLAFLLLL